MQTVSPLIQNGDLVLLPNGQLEMATDIQTQMPVTLTAYNCMYNSQIDSKLIPYFKNIPVGGRNSNAIVNIISAAYQILISAGIITNLQAAIVFQTSSLSYLTIKISAVDTNDNNLVLNWSNAE